MFTFENKVIIRFNFRTIQTVPLFLPCTFVPEFALVIRLCQVMFFVFNYESNIEVGYNLDHPSCELQQDQTASLTRLWLCDTVVNGSTRIKMVSL
jgi:hypothetical protein